MRRTTGLLVRRSVWLSALLSMLVVLSACQPLAPIAESEAVKDAGGEITAFDLAAVDPEAPLPTHPDIRVGELDNGLTYIIRANTEPENRAELRLAINAGSVQEDDDQSGLAHLLEHMLFNGTERFPKQELVDFLESLGIGFGPDLNAYTSFDETVYQLRVPTDDPATVATAFDVLEDWAGYATLDPDEIDAERGVVVEEWRLRDQNASGRIREQLLPVLFGDSQYADRLPIGDMEIVQNAPAEAVVRYYRDWYRPDLMAVVAVGDFDVDEIEQLIVARFSDLPEPETPRERPAYDVPAHDDTRYLVITDPEYPQTIFQLIRKLPATPPISANDYRQNLVEALSDQMLDFRLDEVRRQADSPITGAFIGGGNLVRPVDTYSVGAQVLDERALEGIDAVMTEVERVRRHGFTPSELERAKAEVLSRYEALYKDRENTDSGRLVEEYVRHFLTDESIPGIEVEYDLARTVLPEITVEEVNSVVENVLGEDNRTLFVIAPEKEGLTAPTEEELAGVLADVLAKEIEPYVDDVVEGDLIPAPLSPVDIVAEATIPELDVTEFELANGVRVLVKPTDFFEDEVLFTGISRGGSSLVEEMDVPEADAITAIVAESGVGEYDLSTLLKLLAGKDLNLSPFISELSEGLDGSASPDDLETLLQMAYLYMSAPRVEEDAFEVYKTEEISFLQNRDLDPFSAFQDAVIQARFGDTIRRNVTPIEEIQALDLDRASEIYQDRLGDAGDFTFIFVGNVDVDEVKRLSQLYLGNLPATDRVEDYLDVKPDPPTKVIDVDVFRGQEEQSTVQIFFPGFIDATPENELALTLLQNILDIRLREELREKLGGTYSAYAVSQIAEYPDSTYGVFVGFSAAPERVDELVEAVFAIVDEVKSAPPSDENLTKAKELERTGYEEALRTNEFWSGLLEDYAFDPGVDPLEVLTFEDLLDSLTADDVQAAAQQYLNEDAYIQVVLYPESYEGQID